MKRLTMTLLLLASVQLVKSQILTPVKWSYATKKLSNNEAIVYLKASIDLGWHIYSQHMADGGPTKTVFNFTPSNQYSLVGKTQEPKAIVRFEKMFDMKVGYFEKQAVFQQKVKLKPGKPIVFKGIITFGACNETTCIRPEDVEFSVAIKN